MKAFWWFKENEIAGMARPGFNHFRWLELPFQEAILLSWLGQQPEGRGRLESFNKHLLSYGPRITRFHNVEDSAFEKAIAPFKNREQFLEVFERLAEKTKTIKSFELSEDEVRFTLDDERLAWEIEKLKEKGINTVITLNEHHHGKDVLANHFGLHHFSIEDLGPPRLEQAVELASILKAEREKNHKIALHCLAGIGRTSTMILSAHILLGENPDELLERVKKQNSSFALSSTQNEFLKTVIKFRE